MKNYYNYTYKSSLCYIKDHKFDRLHPTAPFENNINDLEQRLE